jgi:intergrase/recombinase
MKGIPTLGYESRTEAVIAMRAQRLSRRAIAAMLDTNIPNVKTLEAYGRKRDSLLDQRRKQRRNNLDKRRRDSTTRITVNASVARRFRRHATARGITIEELARRLLETIAADNMVDSVLDDQEAARGSN